MPQLIILKTPDCLLTDKPSESANIQHMEWRLEPAIRQEASDAEATELHSLRK